MKFREKLPSEKDKDISTYTFTIGKAELIVLMDIVSEAYIKTPRSLFTQPFTSRVDAMKTEMAKVFKAEGIKYPIKRSDYQGQPGEIF